VLHAVELVHGLDRDTRHIELGFVATTVLDLEGARAGRPRSYGL
jgi:hypothetical protein